ncbi:DUF1624 domain-containing protein [Vampirovibrio chlorellavorus]|uniref:DUF1624 domain-containing protein n=1 Tax=Vampirovibrio chlorellavorus TaxID=758823 RepID=UPI0026EA3E7C|nr:heparan-alpha-glucosaminide N-acetyltransferase domain-containing protein [Vampirovibrio chlorellavorus]
MPSASPDSTSRINSIDIVRGLAITLMTVDHAREFFFKRISLSDPLCVGCLPPEVFFTRWLTHFCAPTFVFLAGVSAYLYSQKPGLSKKDLCQFLITRGFILILLEITLINVSWTFIVPPTTLYLQVIWAIGMSMIALAGMIWLPRPLQILITALLIAAHPLLDNVHFMEGTPQHVLCSILHERNLIPITDTFKIRTSYPLIPWIGMMSAGFLTGPLFNKTIPARQRKRWLLWGGTALLLGFAILRWGNLYGEAGLFTPAAGQPLQTLMSFVNLTKYPPSFLFTLMTVGGTCLALGWLEGPRNAVTTVLLQFGRVSMFYYLLHLYLLHGAAFIAARLWPPSAGEKFSVPDIGWVWLIAAACLLMSYPLIQQYAALKKRHPNSWLRFF